MLILEELGKKYIYIYIKIEVKRFVFVVFAIEVTVKIKPLVEFFMVGSICLAFRYLKL